jgi:hypothetical protein
MKIDDLMFEDLADYMSALSGGIKNIPSNLKTTYEFNKEQKLETEVIGKMADKILKDVASYIQQIKMSGKQPSVNDLLKWMRSYKGSTLSGKPTNLTPVELKKWVTVEISDLIYKTKTKKAPAKPKSIATAVEPEKAPAKQIQKPTPTSTSKTSKVADTPADATPQVTEPKIVPMQITVKVNGNEELVTKYSDGKWRDEDNAVVTKPEVISYLENRLKLKMQNAMMAKVPYKLEPVKI